MAMCLLALMLFFPAGAEETSRDAAWFGPAIRVIPIISCGIDCTEANDTTEMANNATTMLKIFFIIFLFLMVNNSLLFPLAYRP